MNLEQQCVSLELAKKLKDLGVRQESQFFWITDEDGQEINIAWHKELIAFAKIKSARGISAFTVAELGDMLPNQVTREGNIYYAHLANGNGWKCPNYIYYGNPLARTLLTGYPIIFEETEADARAKMLIYLLENKFI